MEQSTELTGTNRSCGLIISLRQTLKLAPRIRVASRDTADGASRRLQATNSTQKFPVVISKRPHPIPSRTRKLSSSEPMVLHGKPCGRVGRRRDFFYKAHSLWRVSLFAFVRAAVGVRLSPPRAKLRVDAAAPSGLARRALAAAAPRAASRPRFGRRRVVRARPCCARGERRARRRRRRRRCDLGWFAVTLRDVRVASGRRADRCSTLREVRVELSAALAPVESSAHGGELRAVGTPEDVEAAIRAWRRGATSAVATVRRSRRFRSSPRRALRRLARARGGRPARSRRAAAIVRRVGRRVARIASSPVERTRGALAVDARAPSVARRRRRERSTTCTRRGSTSSGAGARRRRRRRRQLQRAVAAAASARRSRRSIAGDPMRPRSRRAFRCRSFTRSARGSTRSACCARARSPTGRASRSTRSRSTSGRGSGAWRSATDLSSSRGRGTDLELTFSTQPNASGTPVSLTATLPLEAGDAVLSLAGGPISLALLGVDEGAAGLGRGRSDDRDRARAGVARRYGRTR